MSFRIIFPYCFCTVYLRVLNELWGNFGKTWLVNNNTLREKFRPPQNEISDENFKRNHKLLLTVSTPLHCLLFPRLDYYYTTLLESFQTNKSKKEHRDTEVSIPTSKGNPYPSHGELLPNIGRSPLFPFPFHFRWEDDKRVYGLKPIVQDLGGHGTGTSDLDPYHDNGLRTIEVFHPRKV